MIERKTYLEAVDEMSAPGKFDLKKIDLSIKAVWEFMLKADDILFVGGVIKPMKWYNIFTIFRLAKMAYDLIIKIVGIWKN